MFTFYSRARIGSTLVLGVIVGLALLFLPAMVAPRSSEDTTAGGGFSFLSKFEPTASPSQGAIDASLQIDTPVQVFKLFLFLLFSIALSTLASIWAGRRIRRSWY